MEKSFLGKFQPEVGGIYLIEEIFYAESLDEAFEEFLRSLETRGHTPRLKGAVTVRYLHI